MTFGKASAAWSVLVTLFLVMAAPVEADRTWYYDHEDGVDDAAGVAIDNGRNIYVLATCEEEEVEGGTDVVVVKYDKDGNEVNVWEYGSIGQRDSAVAFVLSDPGEDDPAVYVGAKSGSGTYYVLKFEAENEGPVWVAPFSGPNGSGSGCRITDMAAQWQSDMEDFGVVACGVGYVDQQDTNYLLVTYYRTEQEGTARRGATWFDGGSGQNTCHNDWANAVACNSDGDIFVTGKANKVSEPPNDWEFCTVRYNWNDSVNPAWVGWHNPVSADGADEIDDGAVDIVAHPGPQYWVYVAGQYYKVVEDEWGVKYDSYNALFVSYFQDEKGRPDPWGKASFGDDTHDEVPVELALNGNEGFYAGVQSEDIEEDFVAVVTVKCVSVNGKPEVRWARNWQVGTDPVGFGARGVAAANGNAYSAGNVDDSEEGNIVTLMYESSGFMRKQWTYDGGDLDEVADIAAFHRVGLDSFVVVVGTDEEADDVVVLCYDVPTPWEWEEMAPMPTPSPVTYVRQGGWLAYNEDNGLVYAAKGNKTNEFYAYDPSTNVWTPSPPEPGALETIPAGAEGKSPKKGCRGVYDGVNYIYMTKGNSSLGFHRYNISADSWEQLADVPLGPSNRRVKGGTDLAYADGSVYLLKGEDCEFYRYDVGSGWQALLNAPEGTKDKWKEGSWLVYDGNHTLYAHKARYHELWPYDIASDSWALEPLSGMPFYGILGRKKKSKDGGGGVWHEGCIYALKGGNTQEAWLCAPRPDVTGWGELDTMPQVGSTGKKKKVKGGGDLTAVPGMGLYALKGNRTREFWRYLPGGGWRFAPMFSGPKGGLRDGLDDEEQEVCEGVPAECPRWANAGTWITYSREDDATGFNQVYMAEFGVSQSEVRLTEIAAHCEAPVFSPNDSCVAFMMVDTLTGYSQIAKVSTGLVEDDDEQKASLPLAAQTRGREQSAVSSSSLQSAARPDAHLAAGKPLLHCGSEQQARPEVSGLYDLPVAEGRCRRPVRADEPGEIVQLTFEEAEMDCPEWSPDGEALVCQQDAGDWIQLCLVPAEPGEVSALTSDAADHEWPSYLSDSEVVFQREPPDSEAQICKVNLRTLGITQLTTEARDHEKPCPASDGGSVCYSAYDDGGMLRVGLVSSSGGDERFLTDEDVSDIEEPDFSADGRSIYCVRWTCPGSQIGVVDTSGGYAPCTDSSAIRDNPDAYWYDPVNLVTYERITMSVEDGWGVRPRRKREGTGIFCIVSRRKQGGVMAENLGTLALHRALPNPAHDHVLIEWQVASMTKVTLAVYNIAGQLVRTLAEGSYKPGAYESVWDGRDEKGRKVGAGVYFYSLEAGDFCEKRKCVLAR